MIDDLGSERNYLESGGQIQVLKLANSGSGGLIRTLRGSVMGNMWSEWA